MIFLCCRGLTEGYCWWLTHDYFDTQLGRGKTSFHPCIVAVGGFRRSPKARPLRIRVPRHQKQVESSEAAQNPVLIASKFLGTRSSRRHSKAVRNRVRFSSKSLNFNVQWTGSRVASGYFSCFWWRDYAWIDRS